MCALYWVFPHQRPPLLSDHLSRVLKGGLSKEVLLYVLCRVMIISPMHIYSICLYPVYCRYSTYVRRGVGSILKVGRPCMQGISCTAYVMTSFTSHETVLVANITAYSEIVPMVIRNGSYYCWFSCKNLTKQAAFYDWVQDYRGIRKNPVGWCHFHSAPRDN